jgi:DNA-binding transcriptional MerR regulator
MEGKTESNSEKADDAFFSIGEVSEKIGVKPYVLRYWEREFPFLQPIKNRAGHRLYSQRDIYIVRKIKEMIHQRGYSISGARKILFDVLLDRHKDPRKHYINEIRNELLQMLEKINQQLP